ncbi:phage transcriptional regulator, AlpA [gamma proteobacterium BDW918]|jgi:prophage regulatory protein|uniref:DNA-binding protein n=1 Tax=Zhongshania aliphaticivorans TaxID=1470434 RepID=A0A127M2E1_9GAMM|nr:AlpA family transcriptional regulator [Zhongshania aliphaticivorans]AMO67389.1 DNA-binding protein [Zhongshania aliphaticivorans]EIF42986.1 phage transcriptional regulator, AlpA [gamma proteobacterium BDW918]
MAEKTREILLRRKQIEACTGLSRSTIYALMGEGKFPKPIPLAGRTVAWTQSSVDKWIAGRIAAAKADI